MRKRAVGSHSFPNGGHVFDLMPAFIQKRYRNGQGFIEPLKGRDRPRRLSNTWTEYDEQLYDELFVPMTDLELRNLRFMDEELNEEETEEQKKHREEEEARQKHEEEMKYLRKYLHKTGLWEEARKAGVGLEWLLK